MSFLDTLIYGYRTVYSAAVEITRRNKLNFGAGLVAADNPTTGMTDVTSTAAAGSIPISAGTVATVGDLRAANDTKILAARNAADSGDLTILETDASDNLYVGADSAFANGVVQANFGGSFGFLLHINGSTAIYGFAGSTKLALPVVGYNAPFALNGYTAIDIVDADYTLLAADFSVATFAVAPTTPMTGDRAILYPDATDAGGYDKFVRNTNGGGFNVVVYGLAGFAGTTVTIADGFSARVGFNAAGAYRMTPDVAN